MNAAELRTLLDYYGETGDLVWRVNRRGPVKAGDIAGTPRPNGYIALKINGRPYLAHRLAWLWTHGEWPTDEVDHINGVRDDNRIANLRQATRTENTQNRRVQSNNRLGVKGVDIYNGRFRAKIKIGARHVHIGMYDSISDASAAYNMAAREAFGEFAAHLSRGA